VRSSRIFDWAFRILFPALAACIVVLVWFSADCVLTTTVELSRKRNAAVGMTEDDIVMRLGPPTTVVLPGDDLSAYWIEYAQRPVEGKILLYAFSAYTGGSALFQYVYISEEGLVDCSYMGAGT